MARIDLQTQAPRPTQPDDLEAVGRGLEAHFLRQIMAEFHLEQGAWTGGGFGGETFAGMLQEALADSLAKSGGLGIGKAIEQAMANAPGLQSKTSAEDGRGVSKEIHTSPLKPPTNRSIRRYGGGNED